MLVDRRAGRCIATSAWQSEDAMLATEDRVRPMRDRMSEILGGTPEVEQWEIAILRRDHPSRPGACVRATWVRVPPAEADNAIDVYRMAVLPVMESLDGFCSTSLMINRDTGRAVSSVGFDSQEALERSRTRAAAVRETASRDAHADVLDVREFELALAHLRVPEMA
jgi:hypothetical protein